MTFESKTDLEEMLEVRRIFMEANIPAVTKKRVWGLVNKEIMRLMGT